VEYAGQDLSLDSRLIAPPLPPPHPPHPLPLLAGQEDLLFLKK